MVILPNLRQLSNRIKLSSCLASLQSSALLIAPHYNTVQYMGELNRPSIVGGSIICENTTMKTRYYTSEIKDRAVRMLIEAKDDYPSLWSAIQAIAPKIGCTPETLRSWHKKHVEQTIPANV